MRKNILIVLVVFSMLLTGCYYDDDNDEPYVPKTWEITLHSGEKVLVVGDCDAYVIDQKGMVDAPPLSLKVRCGYYDYWSKDVFVGLATAIRRVIE